MGKNLLLAVALLLTCRTGLSALNPSGAVIYAGSQAGASPVSPRHALLSDKVTLFCALKDGPSLYCGVTFRAASKVSPVPAGATVRWYKVEPYMTHHRQKGNDPHARDFLYYANAHWPFCRQNRGWIGHDAIEYHETELPDFRDKWAIPADSRPTDKNYDINGGLGVMRYRAEVTYDGKKYSTPGLSAKDPKGIKNSVFTVVFRGDDTFLGWLTSYFNVPGVFGSVPAQVKGYTGVDCADLMMAGYNRSHNTDHAYTNVGGMLKYMKSKTKDLYLFSDGYVRAKNDPAAPPLNMAYPKDIAPGDMLFCDYPPYGSWDHIGAFYMDSGKEGKPDGVLNGYDVVIHAGFAEPHLSFLGSNSFVGDDPTRIIIGRP